MVIVVVLFALVMILIGIDELGKEIKYTQKLYASLHADSKSIVADIDLIESKIKMEDRNA